MPGSKFILPKNFENCGAQFNAKTVYSKFCSKKCSEAATSYTIGEISQKYGVLLSSVDKTIRKNSIPKKQIGKFVYVPKVEIDKIFTNK